MGPHLQETADLVTFTEEILNRQLLTWKKQRQQHKILSTYLFLDNLGKTVI